MDDDFEVLTTADNLMRETNRTFLARVRGESMTDAGLFDGEMVVVQKNCPTSLGDIVVPVVDGYVTVK